jgi:CheY-like chemotaxis protein
MLNILLAEDDIDDQELLSETFSEIDPSITLKSFTNGNRIINYLKGLKDKEIPDLIILDYNIPEINGAEILMHLASDKKYKDVVKLVWSTSNASFYEQSCLSLGATAYLVKPSTISGLEEMARKMLVYAGYRSATA